MHKTPNNMPKSTNATELCIQKVSELLVLMNDEEESTPEVLAYLEEKKELFFVDAFHPNWEHTPVAKWMDTNEKIMRMPLFNYVDEAVEYIVTDLNKPKSESIFDGCNVCEISYGLKSYWKHPDVDYPVIPMILGGEEIDRDYQGDA